MSGKKQQYHINKCTATGRVNTSDSLFKSVSRCYKFNLCIPFSFLQDKFLKLISFFSILYIMYTSLQNVKSSKCSLNLRGSLASTVAQLKRQPNESLESANKSRTYCVQLQPQPVISMSLKHALCMVYLGLH